MLVKRCFFFFLLYTLIQIQELHLWGVHSFSPGIEGSDISLLIAGGGWGTFYKQELGRGYNFYLKFFFFFWGGGSVLEHYTVLKTTAHSPPGRN